MTVGTVHARSLAPRTPGRETLVLRRAVWSARMSAVSTVPIDLPAPMAMRRRWAAVAAVVAARGWGRMCHADGPVWQVDVSGGNGVELHHVGGGRAVLVGHDHEYSDTYYGEAAGPRRTPARSRERRWSRLVAILVLLVSTEILERDGGMSVNARIASVMLAGATYSLAEWSRRDPTRGDGL